MSDIATLSFVADTSPLTAADVALDRLAARAATTEAALARMAATTAAAMAKVPAAFGGGAGGASGVAQNTSAQTGLAAATGTATAAMGAQVAALHSSQAAHSAHGGAVYGNRLQMMELFHVFRALTDEMAAGGNIFRGLAMESGRLQIALASGEGGLTGLVGRLGSGFAAMLNPIALATAGVAAFGIASATALAAYESGQDRLQNSLNGIGRRSGATVGQLNQIAAAGAASGGLSTSQSIGLAAQYTGAGLTPRVTQSLLGDTRQYARISGQGLDEAGGALAKAVADPIRGLGELDKQFGVVDDSLRQTITILERSGHIQEAQALAAEAWRKTIESTTVATWGFRQALDGAENWFSNGFSNIGHSIATTLGWNDDSDKLAQRRRTLANIQSVDPVGNADYIRQLQADIERLSKAVGESEAAAAAKQRDAIATQRSGLAGDAVRAYLPDFMRRQTAATQIEAMRLALQDPDIIRHMQDGGLGYDQTKQAFGNAVVMQSMGRPGVQQQQDYQLRMASADAFSIGEKAIIEARRAELEVLRQTGDVTRAATVATMSWNEAIAKGNSDAEDRLGLARQNADMVGLTGLARSQQEIRNKYEGYGGIFSRDSVLDDPDDLEKGKGIIANTRAAMADDMGGSLNKIRMALDDNAPKIDTAGAKIVAALEGVASKLTPIGAAPGALSTQGMPGAFGASLAGFDASKAGPVTGPQMAMMQAYIRAGVSPAAAAGFVGATTTESGINLDPMAINASGHRGIAQWDASRWGQVSGFAGGAAWTREGQTAASLAELGSNERRAGSMLVGSNSVLGGVLASDAYERPGDAAAMARRGLALSRGNALYVAYQGSAAPPLNVAVNGGTRPLAQVGSTMFGADRLSEKTELQADVLGKSITPLINSQQQVNALNASLKVQVDTFGQNADKIQGAAYAQKLLNDYQREGVTVTPALAASIKQLGDEYGDYSKRQQAEQDRERGLIGTEDSIRSTFSSSADSLFTGIATHKPLNQTLRGIGFNIGESLIHGGVNMFTNGLFGKSGQSGGGLFGGILGNILSGHLFASGTNNAPGGPALVGEHGPELIRMPAGAQVIPHNGVAGMRTGAPIQLGDTHVHIHPVGGAQFTDVQIQQINGQVAQGVQQGNAQVIQYVTRNLPQIQSDAGQTA